MNRAATALLLSFALSARAEWTAVGPDGGRLQALAADPADGSRLYALLLEDALEPRLFATTDAGGNWTEVARTPDSTLTSLAVDPHHSDIIYACGRENRVCRSTDRGVTWSRVELDGYAAMVMPDPLVPGRVYAAGYRRSGRMQPMLFRSEDLGLSWTPLPVDSAEGHAMCGDVDPRNAGVVYVGGTNGRLYRSSDAGTTWRRCNSLIPPTATVQSVSVNRLEPDLLLAATTAGLYRSTDAGVSWTMVQTDARAWKAAFSPAEPANACAIGYDFFAEFLVSTDRGQTWTAPSPGMYVGRTDGLLAGPDNSTWLYTSGGAKKTTDLGRHWAWANHGMKVARVLALAAAPQDPATLYLSTTDNGIYRTHTGGSEWERCADFTGCGNIGAVSVGPDGKVYALEGSG